MDKFYYLIKIQFLGFRFSGWQKQKNAKTLQHMVDRTISYVLGHDNHKTLGAGRTDSKVSANEFAFELFVSEPLDTIDFSKKFNDNLPPDLSVLEIQEVNEAFNVLKNAKTKEYLYIFTHEEKPHPFAAPLMVYFPYDLDIDLMKKGAALFVGTHNFYNFCYRPGALTQTVRKIDHCEIEENTIYTANFFPKRSWVFHVHGGGFMRHQVRLMMGALVKLGRGEVTLDDLSASLSGKDIKKLDYIAPSSGLMLNRIEFSL